MALIETEKKWSSSNPSEKLNFLGAIQRCGRSGQYTITAVSDENKRFKSLRYNNEINIFQNLE